MSMTDSFTKKSHNVVFIKGLVFMDELRFNAMTCFVFLLKLLFSYCRIQTVFWLVSSKQIMHSSLRWGGFQSGAFPSRVSWS